MQVPFFVCAQSAAIDLQRNTISLFHIIEEWNSPSFPLALLPFTIAAILVRTGEEPNAVEGFEIVAAHEGQELMRHPTQVNFQGRLRLRILLEIGGLSVASPGIVLTSLQRGGTPIASWPISVRSLAQPTAQVELGI